MDQMNGLVWFASKCDSCASYWVKQTKLWSKDSKWSEVKFITHCQAKQTPKTKTETGVKRWEGLMSRLGATREPKLKLKYGHMILYDGSRLMNKWWMDFIVSSFFLFDVYWRVLATTDGTGQRSDCMKWCRRFRSVRQSAAWKWTKSTKITAALQFSPPFQPSLPDHYVLENHLKLLWPPLLSLQANLEHTFTAAPFIYTTSDSISVILHACSVVDQRGYRDAQLPAWGCSHTESGGAVRSYS